MKTNHRMFKNPILELISISGPKMMTIYHLTLIIGALIYGSSYFYPENIIQVIGLFTAGYFSWTLAEYLLHRYLFHWVSDLKLVQKFHYAMHGYHHSAPNDYNRLFMPPVPVTIFVLIFFGLFFLIFGNNVWFFLPGFELGYLTYAICHYRVHVNPKAKLTAKLSHHHILHHYKYPNKAFGVSTTFWDRVFRTMPPDIKKEAKSFVN